MLAALEALWRVWEGDSYHDHDSYQGFFGYSQPPPSYGYSQQSYAQPSYGYAQQSYATQPSYGSMPTTGSMPRRFRGPGEEFRARRVRGPLNRKGRVEYSRKK